MAPSHATSRPSTEPVVTSFLLGNLHCPTCVSTIKDVLYASCRDQVRWVSPNIVTAVVTVEHDPDASIRSMTAELELAGFKVCSVTSTAGEHDDMGDYDAMTEEASAGDRGSQPSRHKGKQRASSSGWLRAPAFGSRSTQEHSDAHLKNCEECRSKVISSDAGLASRADEKHSKVVSFSAIDSTNPSSSPNQTPKANRIPPSTQPNTMSTKSFVTTDVEDAPTWRVALAVGGMTCAACSNTITNELSKKDWISSITVNLLTNSASVEISDKSKADSVAEAIEDLGYDAAIDSVTNIQDEEGANQQERTVEISIDGMYCEHCSDRVIRSLAPLSQQHHLSVDREPTRQRPVLKVTYVPRAPDFTVRTILAAVEASDRALTASIHHPPTLEERSKQIHRKHQRRVLFRAIFTGILCVPTFILGIVYMSLLPDSNHDKHHLMMPWTSGISRLQMALFILATPVYFFAADEFHVRASKEIWALWRPGSRMPVAQRFYRFGSMNTLMSLGTTIGYVSSTSQLIAAAVYQPDEINNSNFYFDAVVFLTFFLLLGRLIESYTKSKTGSAVDALGKLRPNTAILVEQQQQQQQQDGAGADDKRAPTEDRVVKTDLLDFGDVVRVPHGSSPPADGVIVQGTSSFDESSLTGESRPVRKAVGEHVYAGTVNKDGPVLVRVTGASGSSMLDQIVRVVREGQAKRAPLEQFADLITTYFVPCVTLVAVVTWVVWLTLGLTGSIPGHFLDVTSGGWVAFSLQFAIAVFVVACPCGIALAAPTSIFVGGGLAARHGILAKGGGLAFETASRTDCVVFDKTGTLTVGGEPRTTDSAFFFKEEGEQQQQQQDGSDGEGAVGTIDKPLLLAALKAVEENSSHPVAKALVSFCAGQNLQAAGGGRIDELQETPGKGMRAVFTPSNGDSKSHAFEIIVGNWALMEHHSASVPAGLRETLGEWTAAAKSVALAAVRPLSSPPPSSSSGYVVRGAFAVSDPIRPEAAAVVAALRRRGVGVYMLSGDNEATARAVGRLVGIPEEHVLAEVLPAEKAEKVKYLQASSGGSRRSSNSSGRAIVAMVGDGVNDAPALAQADVGVAVGSGSDVAISSAGFVLVQSDLRNVVTLLELSRAVFRRIKFNFGWALVYNVVAVPVAAGALYPVVAADGQHVRLDPVWASLAMALSSISVVLSSLALRTGWWLVGFRPSVIPVVEEGQQQQRQPLAETAGQGGDVDDGGLQAVVVASEVGTDKI